jgi:hypothetical protein
MDEARGRQGSWQLAVNFRLCGMGGEPFFRCALVCQGEAVSRPLVDGT